MVNPVNKHMMQPNDTLVLLYATSLSSTQSPRQRTAAPIFQSVFESYSKYRKPHKSKHLAAQLFYTEDINSVLFSLPHTPPLTLSPIISL